MVEISQSTAKFLEIYNINYPHFFSVFTRDRNGIPICHLVAPNSNLRLEFTDQNYRILLTMTTPEYQYIEFQNYTAHLRIFKFKVPETIFDALNHSKPPIETLIELSGRSIILRGTTIYSASIIDDGLSLTLNLNWLSIPVNTARYKPINRKELKQIIYRR